MTLRFETPNGWIIHEDWNETNSSNTIQCFNQKDGKYIDGELPSELKELLLQIYKRNITTEIGQFCLSCDGLTIQNICGKFYYSVPEWFGSESEFSDFLSELVCVPLSSEMEEKIDNPKYVWRWFSLFSGLTHIENDVYLTPRASVALALTRKNDFNELENESSFYNFRFNLSSDEEGKPLIWNISNFKSPKQKLVDLLNQECVGFSTPYDDPKKYIGTDKKKMREQVKLAKRVYKRNYKKFAPFVLFPTSDGLLDISDKDWNTVLSNIIGENFTLIKFPFLQQVKNI